MKFKCGLTDEEKTKKRELELFKARHLIEHGEVVFVWLPKRVKPGDCRWLEKMRRFPVSHLIPLFPGDYVDVDATKPEHVAYCPIKWRYEPLDK